MKKNIKKIVFQKSVAIILWSLLMASCSIDDNKEGIVPKDGIFYLPIVVHVMHNGESVGEETNLSMARIERQIEILNEDFRRKAGTRGYNNHPDGGDSKI